MSLEEQLIVEEQLRKRIAALENTVRGLEVTVQNIWKHHRALLETVTNINELSIEAFRLQKGEHEQQNRAVQ